jgi:RNA polymerase sigma-70 factor (ECF subfamily)
MDFRNHEILKPLLKRCIRNDRRAQNELDKGAFPYAMNVALRYAKDFDESLIIVNEAFFKVFRSLEKYDFERSFNTWLRTIIVNTAINHFNNQKKLKEVFLELPNEFEVESTSESFMEEHDAEHILAHIQQLPSSYRMIFSLFAIEGYSHKEIAEELGITEGASKSAYHKAKIKLKQALSSYRLTPIKKVSHE